MPDALPEVTADRIPHYYAGDIEDLTSEFLNGKLGEVVDMIAGRHGTRVRARLASGELTQRLYEAVVVRVASRVFGNTDGFSEENAGQYGYKVNPAAASGTLWLTDDDTEDLTGIKPVKKQNSVIGTASIGHHSPGRRW
jgi:hypothetical protein